MSDRELKNIKVNKESSMKVEETAKRPVRKTLRTKGPLFVEQIKGYHQRWVHDDMNRVEDMKDDLGYDHVLDKKGNPVYKLVRRGDMDFKSYLLKTPNELYEQGKQEKEVEIAKLDAPEEDAHKQGLYGTFDGKVIK